ncbi:NACHT nucleoside triphosphatase [Penicillium herquei]|nr:NACHT nucleoside triphosphatase [Penicillium herquei]
MAQTGMVFQGRNDGCQIGQNNGNVTVYSSGRPATGANVHISCRAKSDPSEVTLNQTCLHDLATTNPHHDKNRIVDMKGGLLKDSYAWILDYNEFKEWRDSMEAHLLWIKGDPGKGKTMLLCGIIDHLTEYTSANIAYFFCQASDARINSATSILRGLIYLLVEKQPSLLSHVRQEYDKMGKRIFQDANSWQALSKILTSILEDERLQPTFLLIDALDECVKDLNPLLDLISRNSSCHLHVKWIVTSRNWPDIEESLQDATGTKLCLELNESSISDAVEQYIQHKVLHLARVKKYSHDLRETVRQKLSTKSQGTFLWVALACQELGKPSTTRWRTLSVLNTLPLGLYGLYRRMINHIIDSEDATLCKQILAIVSTVYRPLTLSELTSFADLPEEFLNDD